MIKPDDRDGVWVVYDYDAGPYVIYVMSGGEQGRAMANQRVVDEGYGRVAFVPFDTYWRDAVVAWEAQEKKVDPVPHEMKRWWDGEWDTLEESIRKLIQDELKKNNQVELFELFNNNALDVMRRYGGIGSGDTSD